MTLSQHCFDRVWKLELDIRTGSLYDAAYTPADFILGGLWYCKHSDGSHLDIFTDLYHLELAHVRSAESGGHRVLCHSRHVGSTLTI